MPSSMSYLTQKRPSQAGGVGAVFICGCFCFAAISVSFSLIISQAIGVGYFFLILSAAAFLSFLIAGYYYYGSYFRATESIQVKEKVDFFSKESISEKEPYQVEQL
jgi:hypothetical protein